jgi:hypothetical protein
MRGGEVRSIGQSQGNRIGQAKMQRFIGIEESSVSGPNVEQKSEHRSENCGYISMVLKVLILVFRQRSLSPRIISSTVGKGPNSPDEERGASPCVRGIPGDVATLQM